MTATYRKLGACTVLATSVVLSGCTTFAALRSPDLKIEKFWHSTLPHSGKPSELVSWWSTFDDPSLSELMILAQQENPDLASATADIELARATLASVRAGLFPGLDGSASLTRSGTEGDAANRIAASTTTSGNLDASWEVDLFGKTRKTIEAARLRTHEQIANWHDARVSLAAEVAEYYVQYRACKQLESAYSDELSSQRETIRATETAAASGLTSSADLALARASAASSSSTLIAQRMECDVLVKSLVQVTGLDETRVRRLLIKGKTGIPRPKNFRITAVPAEALRQRPDVSALEWELVASIAEVGAAKADLYPSLSLGGSVTISNSTLTGKSLPWSFGPALSVPLLDGGSRRAAVKTAIGDYDKAAASYKSGILRAVAEIETALAQVDSTRRQIGDVANAASNYRTYFKSVDANWRAGGASLLDREEARRTAQSAEVTLIETRRDAVRYWIALYKALGGGWDAGTTNPAQREKETQGNLH